MAILVALTMLLLPPGARADATRCEKIRAEANELTALHPVACPEATTTHDTYVKALPEILETCRKLEADAAAGEPKLALGTEDQMQTEIMELKQKHLLLHSTLADHVTRELLPTPLDNNDPARPPPQVSSDCGTEIETHVRFRRLVLRGFNEFLLKIDGYDDGLFQQAAERALPTPRAPASAPAVR